MIVPPLPDNQTEARGWRADDLLAEMVEPYRARFQEYFVRCGEDECWLWTGYSLPSGYGKFLRSHKATPPGWLAHRMAWVLETGRPLLNQLTIDHLCRVRNCVNPAHLEPVTMSVNASRANSMGTSDTCKAGHVGEIFVNGKGHRDCRQCARDRTRRTSASEQGKARRTRPVECPLCFGTIQSKNMARHRKIQHRSDAEAG